MILVDTSVWIDHFRGAASAHALGDLLEASEVVVHPFVGGELALGSLGRRRSMILDDLARLPRASVVPDEEVLHMVGARRLHGAGIGWVDAHLVAAALNEGATLWTHDRALARVVARLRLAFEA